MKAPDALLDAVAVPVLVARDGRCVALNQAARQFFGLERGDIEERPLSALGLDPPPAEGVTVRIALPRAGQPASPVRVEARAVTWEGSAAMAYTVHPPQGSARAAAIAALARQPTTSQRPRAGEACHVAAESLAATGLSVLAFEHTGRLVLRHLVLTPEVRASLGAGEAVRALDVGAAFAFDGQLARVSAGERVFVGGAGPHPLAALLGLDVPPAVAPLCACAVPVGQPGTLYGVLLALAPDLDESDCAALEMFAGRAAAAVAGAHHLEEFEALFRLTHAAGSLDRSQIARDAVQIVAELTRAECVTLSLRENGAERVAWARGVTDEQAARLVEQAAAPLNLRVAAEREGFRRSNVFPLGSRAGPLGSLIVCRRDDRPMGIEEQSLLLVLCAALASALENARLYHDSTEQLEDLQRLFNLGHAVAGEADLPRVLHLAARTAAALVRADEAFLLFRPRGEKATGSLELRACIHEPGEAMPEGTHGLLEAARRVGTAALRQRSALRTEHEGILMAAPLLSGDRPIGALVAARSAGASFDATDVERLRAVADYVALALGSAELLAEQQLHVRELMHLNEVANACAELGLDTLLSSVGGRISRALGAEIAALAFLDNERKTLFLGTVAAPDVAVPVRGSVPIGEGLAGRAVKSRQPRRGRISELNLPELEALARQRGLEHAAAVPLLVKDAAVGAAMVVRAGRPVNDDELRLLSALCTQVAVAVENARLFAEVNRRAADLELVQGVGEVIASSLDPDEILRETGRRLAAAVESDAVRIYIREGSGFRTAAAHGLDPREEAVLGWRPETDPLLARAMENVVPAAVSAHELPESSRRFVEGVGMAEVGAAPLLSSRDPGEDRPAISGIILVGRRAHRRFAPEELRVLGAVSSQLAVALTNARLYAETRRRAEEMAVVVEAGRALVGAAKLEDSLDLVAARLADLLQMRGCIICLLDPKARDLEIAGLSEEIPREVRHARIPLRPPSLVHRAVTDRRAYGTGNAPEDARVDPQLLARWNVRSLFILPLLARDQVVGVVGLGDPRADRQPSQEEVDRVMAVGNQVAIAIERARLNVELERSYGELAATQAQLVERERLAALGELAAQVAHEVRNPLGVIFSSLGSLSKVVHLEGDARRLYDMLREEAVRLNRIVGDLLDFARPTPPTLRPGELDRVVADAVDGAQAFERSRGRDLSAVTTRLSVSDDLPLVPMDERLMRQALMNLVSNAYQALEPGGGRVEVVAGTRTEGGRRWVRVSIADDGPGISPEVRARLFEPFFTTKANGSGLGLAVVRRIVDGHRGELKVESAPGEGSVFHLDLPLEAAGGLPDRGDRNAA